MSRFEDKFRLESHRMKYWDYSSPGLYFLTLNIQNKIPIMGEIKKGEINLSEIGQFAHNEILRIPEYHRRVLLDDWVIMPDHIHLLIELKGYEYDSRTGTNIPLDHSSYKTMGQSDFWWHYNDYEPSEEDVKQYRSFRRRMIVPKIVGKFKMLISKQINILNETPGKRNWQRDYDDRVIRNHSAYLNIKKYIRDNPGKWDDGANI